MTIGQTFVAPGFILEMSLLSVQCFRSVFASQIDAGS